MIIEIAEIDIKPGLEQQFEHQAAQARPFFAAAEGCHGVELQRCIETPHKFLLMVRWETVAHHNETFVGSAGWQAWRDLVGEFIDGKPNVYHIGQVF